MAISTLFNRKRLRVARGRSTSAVRPPAGLDCVCPAKRRRGTIPWGLAGMVGLIVAIECWVARNWLDFSDPVSLSWRFARRPPKTVRPSVTSCSWATACSSMG